MRYLVFLLMLYTTTASAETVTIPWKRAYTYTSDSTYSEEHKWASGRSRNFKNGAPEEGGKIERDGSLAGQFIRPTGTTGPVPVVILMHGCTGLTDVVARWAREKGKSFLGKGIGVLVLDSFGPRDIKRTCGAANYHWGWRRVEDAYSALAWLIENKLAIPDRVYVMGRSNGGTTALMLATSGPVTAHTYKFAHSFAVSPACDALERFAFTMPVTIFTGDKDQANSPGLCRIIDGQNGMVKLVLFKGAHHGFEDRTPAYVFNGWRHEHNPKADKDTMDKALEIVMSDGIRSGSQP